MSSADTTGATSANNDSGVDVQSPCPDLNEDIPSLSRASTRSSHYFSEVEDIEPLLLQYTEQAIEHESEKAMLGKRLFSAVDTSDASGDTAANSSRPTKRARPHPGERDSAGCHLRPVIIAHIPGAKVDHLPYGVQWELARVCAAGGLKLGGKQLIESLSKLSAPSNAEGIPALHSHLSMPVATSSTVSSKEREIKTPWKELDVEEERLSRDPYSAVGGTADDGDWVGGRIHFEATLQSVSWGDPKTRSAFDLKLEAPVMGSSNRFARRFGSSAFMRVQIPNDLRYSFDTTKYGADDVVHYFSRPFVLHHHVFRAFYAKDGHVFLFRTRERFTGDSIVIPPSESSDSARQLSIEELIAWHNRLESNKGQSMSKWAARFALGLSNSVPGLRIGEDCIEEINDIVCRDPSERRRKVPSQMVMTDGCGLTSRNVIRQITHRLGWTDEPVAVQMRVAGAKGLLLSENSVDQACHAPNDIRIRLRPSQIKIDLSNVERPVDPAMLVIDIIKPGRLTTPSRLAEETIINLAENGVPLMSFASLMRDDLQARVDSLTQWMPPEASPYKLYRNIAHADGVLTQRLIRESAGMARARGLTRYDVNDDDREEDEDGLAEVDELLKEQSTAWWADPTSGCPSTISETSLVLLDSGFLPDTCPVLASKLKHCVKTVITQCRNKCHITVPMSCTAFVVPDPCHVLAPNEVHIKSSSRNLVGQDGMATDLVLGDVLVTRHPCKVPTDVQKVTAVYKAELSSYVDVVVVSVDNHCFNGEPLQRHLASMTGGGDFDGDTLEVFWDPILVSHFENADPVYAHEPEEVQAALSKNPESVKQFLGRTSSSSDDIKLVETQQYLLGCLRNVSRVGAYSNWWMASAFKHGYSHPDTIFLAYMFTNILDGAKTGVTVSDSIFQVHRKKFGSLPLPWASIRKKTNSRDEFVPDEQTAKRAAHLPPFVLQELYNELMRQCAAHERQLDKLFPDPVAGRKVPLDAHLAAPWRDAKGRAEEIARTRGDTWMAKELEAISKHVEEVYAMHRKQVRQWSSGSLRGKARGAKSKGGASFSDRPIERRQDTLRELSRAFEEGPVELPDGGGALLCFDKPALRRLRASYAYIHDHDTSRGGWSRFPWDVAMRTLCQIKVEALGGGKTLTEDFYYKMAIPKSFVKQG